jgi:type IV pilus assembly protein PilN
MPEGVYLTSLKQNGLQITLAGFAQASARVSALMRNVESSQWLENPRLMEIKAVTQENRRLNEFSMVVTVKRTLNQEADRK